MKHPAIAQVDPLAQGYKDTLQQHQHSSAAKLATSKFGVISADVRHRIETADAETLDE